MELKQVKELMAAMERAGIKKLMIKEKTGYEIHLERQHDSEQAIPHPMALHYPPSALHGSPIREMESAGKGAISKTLPAPEETAAPAAAQAEKEGAYVTSPMVGTYYSAASPEAPLFVKVGDRVEENTVVCIIEAMKVMNEVKAGMKGTVAEICLTNAHPVEFGTKILRIV